MKLTVDLDYVNMDDQRYRRALQIKIDQMRGPHSIVIHPVRGTTSQKQRGYYRGVIVKKFAEWRRDENGEAYDPEESHEILAGKFLKREWMDPSTGELISYIASTSKIGTDEMTKYIEECRLWLAQWCDIQVPDPDPEWKEKENAA